MPSFTRVRTESGAEADVNVELIKLNPENYVVINASDISPFVRPTTYPGDLSTPEIDPETAALLESLTPAVPVEEAPDSPVAEPVPVIADVQSPGTVADPETAPVAEPAADPEPAVAEAKSSSSKAAKASSTSSSATADKA